MRDRDLVLPFVGVVRVSHPYSTDNALGTLAAKEDANARALSESRIQKERVSGLLLMSGGLDKDGVFHPPVISPEGQLFLGMGFKQDTIRAYNQLAVNSNVTLARPGRTHCIYYYPSVPNGSYTDYMATCFANGFYCSTTLTSIGKTQTVKNGAIIAFITPDHKKGELAASVSANNNHMLW